MAFSKKTWKNRISEYFNRYKMENASSGAVQTVFLNLDDGAVSQQGDVLDATSLNDLETRIDNEFTVLEGSLKVLQTTLAAGSTTVTFTDDAITSTSLLDVYTDVDGVNPSTKSLNNHTVTLTFDAYGTNVGVKLMIRNMPS